jgi:uncharacterized protein YkwD/LysM repeat protein
MLRIPALLLIILLLAALPLAEARAAQPPSLQAQASEVFGLINGYRSANGIPTLSQNNILMQTAQGQSDYQASIQQVTHGGPGASRPIDRAYAAGYGGGQVIFISELITGGFNQSPEGALNWWQNSSEHNYYLLNGDYVELGIGVASDSEGRVYYTAVMGHVAGGTTYEPETEPESPAVEAQPVMIPVVRAEPRENGALVHIVRTGQALWTIAAVYDVPLETIYALNNLNVYSFIFPGDEIILKEPDPATPTPTPAPPTATPEPTRTATPDPEPLALANGSEGEAAASGSASTQTEPRQPAIDPEAENATTRLIIMLALGSILAVILASFFIQNKQPAEEAFPEDDPFAPLG